MSDVILITGGSGGTAQAIKTILIDGDKNVLAPSRNILDVASPYDVMDFMRDNPPSILINCAGFIKPDSVVDSDIDEWEKQIAVNLLGTYYCTHYALQNGAKTIINIASAGGVKGRKDWSAYCAAKAGVISFTESLVEEGVDAYCVSPHRIDTKMRHSLFPYEDANSLISPESIKGDFRYCKW